MNIFEEFLSKVTSKVKSKEAHQMIKKELYNHLQDLSRSFQEKASSKEEADCRAIQEMGNPYTLGENLNRLHKPKTDWLLIILFIILAAISFLPLIKEVPGFANSGSFFFDSKIRGYMISILVIIFFIFFDYRKLQNLWTYFYGTGLMLHLYTYSFGITAASSKNWISIFGINVDVTIISLFLFFLAWTGIFNKINYFNNWIKQTSLFFLFWMPILIYLALPQVFFSIIYFFCILVMFIFSQVPKKLANRLVLVNLMAGVIFIGIISLTSFREHLFIRISTFLNPDTAPNGAGNIYIFLSDIFSQAGWFGNGFKHDLTTQSIPSPHTDFAFPYLVYTFGWVFGIVLCLILLTFILRISINAFKSKEKYGRLIVIGGTALFTLPTLWSILMGL